MKRMATRKAPGAGGVTGARRRQHFCLPDGVVWCLLRRENENKYGSILVLQIQDGISTAKFEGTFNPAFTSSWPLKKFQSLRHLSSICQADIRILFARKPKVVPVNEASDVLQWDQFAATYPVSDNMDCRQQRIK
eukprot:s3226_g3.t1